MDDETRRRRDACTRFVLADGLVRPMDQLRSIPDDVVADVYGQGGVVAELEAHIARLLGKSAALYLPSGTMAQAATLRVHADACGRRTVLWHPYCHLDRHEGQAHARLHQLTGRPVGPEDSVLALADLQQVAEPFGALLIELPQRDIGGRLPEWDDLVRQVDWAHDRGAVAHLDGARLWEAATGYGRSPAEVAALFDTVYVSFYKGIGALPGCCVAGDPDVVDQVREWRGRLGGTLFALWPGAASALARLPDALAQMPQRLAHARRIATALGASEGVTVVPGVPQTSMMHLLLRVAPERFAANTRRLAEEERLWLWPEGWPTPDPGVVRCELTVGRATCAVPADEFAALVGSLLV